MNQTVRTGFGAWQPEASAATAKAQSDWLAHMDDHMRSIMGFWAGATGETLSFMATRLEEDMRLQSELMRCHNPTDLRRVWEEFLQRTLDQYAEQTGRIMALNHDKLGSLTGPLFSKTVNI